MHRRRWRRMDEVDHVSIAWPFSWTETASPQECNFWICVDIAGCQHRICFMLDKAILLVVLAVPLLKAISSELGILFTAQDPGMWSTVEDYVKFCQMLLTGAYCNGIHNISQLKVQVTKRTYTTVSKTVLSSVSKTSSCTVGSLSFWLHHEL